MPVRFKRSYRDRKQAVAKRKKVIIKVLIIIFTFQILFTVFFSTIKLDTISMEPSLDQGSIMVFSPMVYGLKLKAFGIRTPQISAPARGDLIVLSPPYISEKKGLLSFLSSFIKFLSFGKIDLQSIGARSWENQTLVKRVVAIPGDTIKIQNFTALIRSENSDYFLSEFEVIDASYDINIGILPEGWDNSIPFSGNMTELKLEENEYFVLGDNRMQSSDSTSWGVLNRENIEGKVLMTYWPFNKIRFY